LPGKFAFTLLQESRVLKRTSIPNGRRGKLTSVAAAVMAALYGGHVLASDAPASPTAGADAPEAPDSGSVAGGGFTEVLITATRRAASAQNVPISITAVSAAQLEQGGIEDISALTRSMAGVNYTDKGPFGGVNGANLIIRGLNSETTAGLPAAASPVVPPVATYVDDTPVFVNLRLLDLERVEILRGPQGTLYGSGSLGGTVRFVEKAPDPTAFDGSAEVGVSSTRHTHTPNEDVSAMLNIPLADSFALRMNAGLSHDAGFTNQPNLYVLDSTGAPVGSQPFGAPRIYSKEGANSYEYRSARVAALWKPSEAFSAQLSYHYQLSKANAFPYAARSTDAFNRPISPATQPQGDFSNPSLLPQLYDAPIPAGVDALSDASNGPTTTRDRVDLAALTLEYDLGFATLTSNSSWAHHVNETVADETGQYINFAFFQNLYGQNPRAFVQGLEGLDDRPLTQELRLTSKTGGRLDWVTGLFYNDQTTDIQEHDFYRGYFDFYNACQASYGQSSGDGVTPSYCGVGETAYTPGLTTSIQGIPILKDQAYIGDFETHFKDLAAYGELTWHVTSAWSLTGGARVFKQAITASQQTGLLFDGGPFFGPVAPIANITLSHEWRKALWKLNTAYNLDKNNLIYATWSQGFRRGGVNALPPSEPGFNYTTPPALRNLSPDTADNYEIGVKGTVPNLLRYSAAIFDIQWHNVQEGLQLTPLVLPASLNIGQAYSRGIETELDVLMSQYVEVQLDYTYDLTRLTSVNALFVQPNTSAPPPAIGSPLPGTPKSSVALGLQTHTPLGAGELQFGVSAHYQSAVLPALSATVPTVGGYVMLNTRLAYSRNHWLTTLYVNNVTDNLGVTSYQDPAIFGNRAQAIVSQPRTVGLTVSYSLKR
jgi:iron complex outermembrane receptor protein